MKVRSGDRETIGNEFSAVVNFTLWEGQREDQIIEAIFNCSRLGCSTCTHIKIGMVCCHFLGKGHLTFPYQGKVSCVGLQSSMHLVSLHI